MFKIHSDYKPMGDQPEAINMLADGIKEVQSDKFYTYGREGKVGARNPKEIGIHAIRGGNIVGEHEVLFAGCNESVLISHTAMSREILANGAVCAAAFVIGKGPGAYSMKNIFSE